MVVEVGVASDSGTHTYAAANAFFTTALKLKVLPFTLPSERVTVGLISFGSSPVPLQATRNSAAERAVKNLLIISEISKEADDLSASDYKELRNAPV
jgi:hypothetical protein